MTVLNSPLLWTASLLLMDFIYIYIKRVCMGQEVGVLMALGIDYILGTIRG